MTNSKSVPCLPPADVDPTEAAVESLLPVSLLPLEPPVHPNAVWTRAGLEVAVNIRQCVVQSVLLQILQLLGPESLEVVHHEGQSAALAGARERPGRRPDGEAEAVPAVEVAAVLQSHPLLLSRGGETHWARLLLLGMGIVQAGRQSRYLGLDLHRQV